jgi:hypothetical protein
MLLDEGDNPLVRCGGAAVTLAANVLAIGGPCPGGFPSRGSRN